MEAWTGLFDILLLLSAALVLGALAGTLRQSAIIGYLVAGMLIGPNVLGWVGQRGEVVFIAELGVTLLLFSIGLEFSLRRLIKIGPVTYLGGTAQVVLTALAGAGAALYFGLSPRTALAVGMMVSLSSTACVIRLLVDQAHLDSIYGRNTLGILLLQDIAVVPLILITFALGGKNTPLELFATLGRTVALAAGLVGLFYLFFNYLVPRLLNFQGLSRNRELPVLLAVTLALGSAWAAHEAGLSPSFGAFLAGLLLAESPFATQIRADIGSLRTILVTLFFAAIGMLVDPAWIMKNSVPVAGVLALIIIFKPLLVYVIVRSLDFSRGPALATGACLGQIGEFSFVLAGIAAQSGLIGNELFRLIVSVTVLSLLLTPYMVDKAPALARLAESLRPLFSGNRLKKILPQTSDNIPVETIENPLIIIGFGPSGRQAAESLLPHCGKQLVILDSNPSNAEWAEGLGLRFQLGNARQSEILENLQIRRAAAVILTLPDPGDVRHIIHLCKALAPEVKLFVRARYHIFKWEMLLAGAETVIDEEVQVGRRLAEEALLALQRKETGAGPADEI